eukprot:5666865-Prymnesium_polylepis.1
MATTSWPSSCLIANLRLGIRLLSGERPARAHVLVAEACNLLLDNLVHVGVVALAAQLEPR